MWNEYQIYDLQHQGWRRYARFRTAYTNIGNRRNSENHISDDVSDIAAFYNADPEREPGRLELHQLELDLTWRY